MKIMKRNLFITMLYISFSVICNAQITKIAIDSPIKNQGKNIQTYDSTSNFLGKEVMQYIGQTLYLKENETYKNRYNGYIGLLKKIPTDKSISLFANKENIYKPILMDEYFLKKNNLDTTYVSEYKELKDKYFYVCDVLKDSEKSANEENKSFYIQLKNLSNNDTLYLYYTTALKKWALPFLIVGYFEKLKQLYIGQTYEFYDPALVKAVDNDIYLSPDTVKYSGKRYSERNNTIWKCIDISIEDGNNYDLVAVLYNEELGKAYAKIDEILPENYMNSRLWNCKTNEMNVSIYGQPTFDLIRQKRIRIGMKRDACLLSWGEPQDIIRSTDKNATTEQWTYKSGETLFFKNGLLEKVQQQRTDK